MKKLIFLSSLLFYCSLLPAQNLNEQAGNFLRGSNKLVVVITVLLTIFAGIIIFLVRQERKISRIEKQLKDKVK